MFGVTVELWNAIAQLSENKLLSSLLPVIVGAGLLAWLFKLRDRRVAIRDESFKFVSEVADLLNRALSPLFGVIRRRDRDLTAVNKGISDLFERRLSTRAKSIALLRAEAFWREYERITWHLRECADQLHEDLARHASLNWPPDAETKAEDRLWRGQWEVAEKIWQDANSLVIAGINRALRDKPIRMQRHSEDSSGRGPRND